MMTRIQELEKQIQEIQTNEKQRCQNELELEKQKIEFEYPFHFKGECWQLRLDGLVSEDWWSNSGYDRNCYQQGNMFTTQQEAIKERDRRILLTRFRHFRDKCNGDWKPESDEVKYYIFLECIKFFSSMFLIIRFVTLSTCLVILKTKKIANVLQNCLEMKLRDYIWRNRNE